MNRIKVFSITLLILGCIFITSSASAQLLANPARVTTGKPFELDLSLSSSEVEYEGDGGGSADIERTILGVTGAMGIAANVDLYGSVGGILEAEPEDSSEDGDGILLAGGSRILLIRQNQFDLLGLAQVLYIDEDYDSVDGEILEVNLGATGAFHVTDPLMLYAGVDVHPYSDGEVKGGGFKTDIERETIVGLRLGIQNDFNGWYLRGEAALISEQTLTVSIGVAL